MPLRSSSSYLNRSVSIFVSVKTPLKNDDPIWALVKSSFPASRINLFFIGEAHSFQDVSVLKKHKFKSLKIITQTSKTSIYVQASRLTADEIVLFTGSDCAPDRQWVKEIVSVFKRDHQVALVLGEVQWRAVHQRNKVEQYSEQTGLNSVGQMLGCETATEIAETKEGFFELPRLDRIVTTIQEPTNLAVHSSALNYARKPGQRVSLNPGFNMLCSLVSKKLKFFYQPTATVEIFRSMTFKKLDKLMFDRASERAEWLQRQPSKSLRLELQFFGKHEISIPFWVSFDASWGDFYWIHFWGVWVLQKFFYLGFSTRFSGAFWATDGSLLIGSIFGLSLFCYFLPILKVQPWSNFIVWCWIRYRSNMSMFLGGLWASLKFRCFYWPESW